MEAHLAVCRDCTISLRTLADNARKAVTAGKVAPTVVQRIKNRLTRRVEHNGWERFISLLLRLRTAAVMIGIAICLTTVGLGLYRYHFIDATITAVQPAVSLSAVARKPAESLSGGRDSTPLDKTGSLMPNFREVELASGDRMISGERFQLRYELSQPAQVYFFWKGVTGRLRWLDADGNGPDPRSVKPNRTYVFPASDRWLQLESGSGPVALYLVAVPTIIADPDTTLQRLEVIGIDAIDTLLPNAIVQRIDLNIR
jgi:hypothetical protein